MAADVLQNLLKGSTPEDNWHRCGHQVEQGCQIFLVPNIPKWEKYIKWPQTRPKGCKIDAMAVKYSKWSLNIPTFTIQRLSKIYPNLEFLVWNQTIWQPWGRIGQLIHFVLGRSANKKFWQNVKYDNAPRPLWHLIKHFQFEFLHMQISTLANQNIPWN
jgi:hypothetical protein